MFGIKNPFARERRGTLPEGIKTPAEFVQVWLSPHMPQWDYVPLPDDGPFRLIRASLTDEAIYGWVESDEIVELIGEFAIRQLPATGEVCVILDRHAQIVLGWNHENPGFRWAGCEHAYSILAHFLPPAEVAIWEMQAKTARDLTLKEQSFHHE